MMDAAIIRTIMALSLTILLELLAFWFFIKSKIPKEDHLSWIIFIIGLNLFTNPLAHFIYYSLSTQILTGFSWIITESLVVLMEAILINLVMLVAIRKALIYSLILNGTSIVLGEYIWWGLYLLH
jgi:hypothetical protein